MFGLVKKWSCLLNYGRLSDTCNFEFYSYWPIISFNYLGSRWSPEFLGNMDVKWKIISFKMTDVRWCTWNCLRCLDIAYRNSVRWTGSNTTQVNWILQNNTHYTATLSWVLLFQICVKLCTTYNITKSCALGKFFFSCVSERSVHKNGLSQCQCLNHREFPVCRLGFHVKVEWTIVTVKREVTDEYYESCVSWEGHICFELIVCSRVTPPTGNDTAL